MIRHFRGFDPQESGTFFTAAYGIAVSHGATWHDAAITGAENARFCWQTSAVDCSGGGINGENTYQGHHARYLLTLRLWPVVRAEFYGHRLKRMRQGPYDPKARYTLARAIPNRFAISLGPTPSLRSKCTAATSTDGFRPL